MYVTGVNHISIRDLQKITGETIGDLRGPTPVKSGDRTIAMLVPLTRMKPERLAAVLKEIEEAAAKRDLAAEDRRLAGLGVDVDPVNWTFEEVAKLKKSVLKPNK